jgi:hypothetical protein
MFTCSLIFYNVADIRGGSCGTYATIRVLAPIVSLCLAEGFFTHSSQIRYSFSKLRADLRRLASTVGSPMATICNDAISEYSETLVENRRAHSDSTSCYRFCTSDSGVSFKGYQSAGSQGV